MTDDSTLAARSAALDLMQAVLRKQVPFDDALEAHTAARGLELRDRAFLRLLCATLFRRLGQIDALILAVLAEPGKPPKGAVLDLLRLGTAQLLFLGTAAHAAVDTTVDLAAARNQTPYKGLLNAVLRRLAAEGPALLAAQDAGRLNTPDWLWLSWRHHYGTGRTRAIVDAHLHEAPLDITVRRDPELWATQLQATILPTGTLRRPSGGNVTELPGFAEGAWWVQDAAAAMPARLFGDLRDRTIVDLCAAPGGKTAQLSAAGARVTAVDRNPRRLKRLDANLSRLGLLADTVEADAAKWRPDEAVDGVLLDAPCSATGTIRRHPDVARIKTAEDVARLVALQRRLLDRAAGMLKPGGLLVYGTCSLQPEEGEAQAAALLSRNPSLRRLPIQADEVGGLESLLNADGDLRATPGDLRDLGGLDGFFVARFQRNPTSV